MIKSKLKIAILSIIVMNGMLISEVRANNLPQLKSGVDYPAEIEDPQCLGINKEAYHATLMPYANLQEALVAKRHASSYYRNLNGQWKFNWVPSPEQRPVDFINRVTMFLHGKRFPSRQTGKYRDMEHPSTEILVIPSKEIFHT